MQKDPGNITFDEPGITIASNFSIPVGEVLFSEEPYFSTIANGGYLSDAAIIRGHFNYDVQASHIDSLWFDIDAAFYGNLAVTFNLTGPLNNNNFVFSPGTFLPSAFNIPGIFSLKPTLDWDIGADVGAVGPVYHSSNITVAIPDGHVHVDFLNLNNSRAVGWSPRLTSSVTTEEAATGHLSPFVDFSVGLALDVLNGRYNVTGGVAARPQFVNEFNVAQSQTRIRRAESMIWARNVTCSRGFELVSDFNFTVSAFVSNGWQKTLYTTEIPIADECYHF
ncbi:hypothetical protein F4804DRAFT_300429 [Jackrogersella minutella]|nr:hypothetical protein F4804DRAFT_300429 [Jackrogersella minutella]